MAWYAPPMTHYRDLRGLEFRRGIGTSVIIHEEQGRYSLYYGDGLLEINSSYGMAIYYIRPIEFVLVPSLDEFLIDGEIQDFEFNTRDIHDCYSHYNLRDFFEIDEVERTKLLAWLPSLGKRLGL